MTDAVELDLDEIASLCRRFHVRRLAVFGSAVDGTFDPASSDIDFIVEFDDDLETKFAAYFDLKAALEASLGRPVDLVMPKALDNPYLAASVERSRQELYAA